MKEAKEEETLLSCVSTWSCICCLKWLEKKHFFLIYLISIFFLPCSSLFPSFFNLFLFVRLFLHFRFVSCHVAAVVPKGHSGTRQSICCCQRGGGRGGRAIVGQWPLTPVRRRMKGGGEKDSVVEWRAEGFCFTPLLTFAAQPEVSYKCEENFQTPGGFRCWKEWTSFSQPPQKQRNRGKTGAKDRIPIRLRNKWNGSRRREAGPGGGKQEERRKESRGSATDEA